MKREVRTTAHDQGPAALKRSRVQGEAAIRTCIVTREEKAQDALLRFVLAPDGSVVADIAGRLPGRGVYVTARRTFVQEAVKRSLFARAFKKAVAVAPDLCAVVDNLLVIQARQALSLAKKAGLVTSGFGKVEAEIGGRRVAVLLHAADGRPDGIGKLDRKFRAVQSARGQPAPIIAGFNSAELSLAMGGENVIHAALAAGGQTRVFLRCCARLQSFRMLDGQVSEARGDAVLAKDVLSITDQAGTDQNE